RISVSRRPWPRAGVLRPAARPRPPSRRPSVRFRFQTAPLFALGGTVKMSAPIPRDPMIPSPPKPLYSPGTRLRVVQHVRVGSLRWRTETTGAVESESFRPIGGMEMGTKAVYCHQPSLRLRRDDGEVIVVAIDENTEVEPIS